MRLRLILAAAIVAVACASGRAMESPPETILLAIDVDRPKNPPVEFDHKAHFGYVPDCRTCHHRDPADIGQKCSGCHGGDPEMMNVPLRQAYHKKCMGCHSKIGKGPTKCPECHGNGKHVYASPTKGRRSLQ